MKKAATVLLSVLVMSIVLCLASCKSHERCPAYGSHAEPAVKHNHV